MEWNARRRSNGRRGLGMALVACAVAAGTVAMDRNGRVTAEAGGVPAAQVGRVSGPAGTMRADVTLRQQQFRPDGRAARPAAPALAMRLERRHTGGKWQSSFTFLATEAVRVQTRAGVVPLENPFMAARLELDEDTGEARIFDRLGRRRAMPGREDLRSFGLSDADRQVAFDTKLFAEVTKGAGSRPGTWGVTGFLADRGQRGARQRELQRRFGRAAGRVRGLDRFVSMDGLDSREVLVAPDSALPVEVNVVARGALSQRTELAYTSHALGDIRHWLRSERALGPSTGGDRLVTEIALTDVALATGGGQ